MTLRHLTLAIAAAVAAHSAGAQAVTTCSSARACMLGSGATAQSARPNPPTQTLANPTGRVPFGTPRTARNTTPTTTTTVRSPTVIAASPWLLPYVWPDGIYYGLYPYPTVARASEPQASVEVTIYNYPTVEVPVPGPAPAAVAPAPDSVAGTVSYTVIVLPPAAKADSGAFTGSRLRFVAIDSQRLQDRRVFDQIIRDLCLADPYKDCTIVFFNAAAAVPYKLPLGPEFANLEVAEFRLNGVTGAEQLRFMKDGKPIE